MKEHDHSSFILHPISFPQRLGYFGVSILVLLSDQLTKFWAWSVLQHDPDQTISVFKPFFSLTFALNTGIAFSLFGTAPSHITRWVLLVIAFAAATGVIVYSLKTSLRDRRLLWALSLILGGIVGNASDRVVYGAVVDFLHFFWRDYHWPIFNVADSAICVGAFLLAVDVLFLAEKTAAAPQSTPCPEPQDG